VCGCRRSRLAAHLATAAPDLVVQVTGFRISEIAFSRYFSTALLVLGSPAMAFAEAEAATKRISYVRIRPRIMLIRIEPTSAPLSDWGLAELDAEVLHVKHPLPACERMRITRPAVVIVGEDVRPVDLAFIKRAARETGARVVQVGPLLVRTSMRNWIRTALAEVLDAASGPAEAAQ
jgi:hypothetical protein